MKILLVDDEENIRFFYSEELTEIGYEVITTDDDCCDLIEMIKKENPDVILLDIMLKKHNGLDILQDIRNKFYDLPVILITAYETFKGSEKSIAANSYVVKSANLTILKEEICRVLEATVN